MPKPLAICIENLNARSRASRYLRCVALPGRQPGLRLDKSGSVLWQREDVPACELWVSADERLMLYRQEGMVPVRLERAGRVLDAPFAKPVVLADQDQITIGRRRLRIHIHGEVSAVSPLAALPTSPRAVRRLAQAAATAVVVGTVMTVGGCKTASPTIDVTSTIEVLEAPPVIVTVEVTPDEIPTSTIDEPSISELIQGEWMAAQVYETGGEQAWYTGTLTIEGDTYTFKPFDEVVGTSVNDALDFLFANPSGEIAIDFASNLSTEDVLDDFNPGDVLATCVFHADGKASEEFEIRVRDGDNLEFYQWASEGWLWRIVKQVGGSAAP